MSEECKEGYAWDPYEQKCVNDVVISKNWQKIRKPGIKGFIKYSFGIPKS